MRKILIVVFVIVVAITFSSCASMHSGLPHNVNSNTTNVVLQSRNYEVIQRVEGTATGITFLGISFTNALINNARSQMLQTANLIGSSRAIINETIEKDQAFFVFFGRRVVTVSAHVIEFTD